MSDENTLEALEGLRGELSSIRVAVEHDRVLNRIGDALERIGLVLEVQTSCQALAAVAQLNAGNSDLGGSVNHSMARIAEQLGRLAPVEPEAKKP